VGFYFDKFEKQIENVPKMEHDLLLLNRMKNFENSIALFRIL